MAPGDDEEPDSLPTKLPKGPLARPRFSHAAIDYSINKQLQGLVPAAAGAVILDVKLTSGDDVRVLQGVVAAKINDRWGLVLAGSLDLVNRRNYQVEILAVRS